MRREKKKEKSPTYVRRLHISSDCFPPSGGWIFLACNKSRFAKARRAGGSRRGGNNLLHYSRLFVRRYKARDLDTLTNRSSIRQIGWKGARRRRSLHSPVGTRGLMFALHLVTRVSPDGEDSTRGDLAKDSKETITTAKSNFRFSS